MRIEVTGELFADPVTESQIDDALALLTGERGEAFAILSQNDMTYIQTSGWPEVGFDLEYQEGSLHNHFRCTKENLTLEEVSWSFKQYVRGDASYKEELPWERDELLAAAVDNQTRLPPFLLPAVAIVVVAIIFLIWQLSR